MSLSDDYRLLELDTNATEQEAKAAYRHLANLYHPDKNPDKDTTEHFQSLHTAYQNVLAAIRQGAVVQDWHKYDFAAHSPHFNTGSTATNDPASEELQRQYIKERQQAYEEMKRNTINQERAREAALRKARHTINEKKAKEMYEQAFKSSHYETKFNANKTEEAHDPDFGIDPALFNSFDQVLKESGSDSSTNKQSNEELDINSLNPVKATLRAVSYLVTFALGVYATMYWQDSTENIEQAHQSETNDIVFIAGLYPQYRTSAINHTFKNAALYSAPDVNAPFLTLIPEFQDLTVTNSSRPNWLAVRYQDQAGWVEEKNIGFGNSERANTLHCIGSPGVAPEHGEVLSPFKISGSSRLRLINQLPTHSVLTFESYEGAAPFSVYLNSRQSLAINYIPKGRYRLLVSRGALFHNACQQFLFDQESYVLLDQVEFTSIEQTLTLQ
ncbi:J domain-containing protein [Marinomonas agarivorans]|nr:J domain-containing protein [Marinomonas agarivorans]